MGYIRNFITLSTLLLEIILSLFFLCTSVRFVLPRSFPYLNSSVKLSEANGALKLILRRKEC